MLSKMLSEAKSALGGKSASGEKSVRLRQGGRRIWIILVGMIVTLGNIQADWGTPVKLDSVGGSSPSISADGKWLYVTGHVWSGDGGAYITRSEFKYGTWQMAIDLGSPVNIEQNGIFTQDPCVSSDNSKLYFSSNRSGSMNI